jgi:hypothetical protein
MASESKRAPSPRAPVAEEGAAMPVRQNSNKRISITRTTNFAYQFRHSSSSGADQARASSRGPGMSDLSVSSSTSMSGGGETTPAPAPDSAQPTSQAIRHQSAPRVFKRALPGSFPVRGVGGQQAARFDFAQALKSTGDREASQRGIPVVPGRRTDSFRLDHYAALVDREKRLGESIDADFLHAAYVGDFFFTASQAVKTIVQEYLLPNHLKKIKPVEASSRTKGAPEDQLTASLDQSNLIKSAVFIHQGILLRLIQSPPEESDANASSGRKRKMALQDYIKKKLAGRAIAKRMVSQRTR